MRAMLIQPGSDVVSPYKLARQDGRWQGRLALADFERMGSLVGSVPTAVVAVSLDFRRDDEGRCRVSGRVTTEAMVECGRCLLPQPCTVSVAIDVCVVGEEQASTLPDTLEPYVLDGDEVRIRDLVEDDLILGIPHEVCRDGDSCPNRPRFEYGDPEGNSGGSNNPFASLADLVGKRR